jgi:hypothetical protein
VTRTFAVRGAALAAVVFAAAVCGQQGEPAKGMPAYTDKYMMRVTSDPAPPRARQRTTFKIVVRDKESGQPIDGGEGLLYGSTNPKQKVGDHYVDVPVMKVWDSFVAGAEPGTYYANVNYVIAADWAMALRFRKDSTQKLEQVEWMQTVNNATGEAH